MHFVKKWQISEKSECALKQGRTVTETYKQLKLAFKDAKICKTHFIDFTIFKALTLPWLNCFPLKNLSQQTSQQIAKSALEDKRLDSIITIQEHQ
jgi:hypothetical protein